MEGAAPLDCSYHTTCKVATVGAQEMAAAAETAAGWVVAAKAGAEVVPEWLRSPTACR